MFKVKFKSKLIIFSCLLLCLYFCSNDLIYAQNNQSKGDQYVIPMGNVIQIDAELKTIIVRNEVKDSNLQVGDAILKLDNKDLRELIKYIIAKLVVWKTVQLIFIYR